MPVQLLCALKTGVLGTHYTCGVQRAPQVRWSGESLCSVLCSQSH